MSGCLQEGDRTGHPVDKCTIMSEKTDMGVCPRGCLLHMEGFMIDAMNGSIRALH